MDIDPNNLSEAIRSLDTQSRPARVNRIVWLSAYEKLPSAIMGRTETLYLLKEAREVFVDGHFAAALLLAIAVINHSLIEELQIREEVRGDPGYESVLRKSQELQLLPSDWFDRIRKLVSRRHAFDHFKEPDHPHALGARVMQEKTRPVVLLEQDAREALVLMYGVFRATLREAT